MLQVVNTGCRNTVDMQTQELLVGEVLALQTGGLGKIPRLLPVRGSPSPSLLRERRASQLSRD